MNIKKRKRAHIMYKKCATIANELRVREKADLRETMSVRVKQ